MNKTKRMSDALNAGASDSTQKLANEFLEGHKQWIFGRLKNAGYAGTLNAQEAFDCFATLVARLADAVLEKLRPNANGDPHQEAEAAEADRMIVGFMHHVTHGIESSTLDAYPIPHLTALRAALTDENPRVSRSTEKRLRISADWAVTSFFGPDYEFANHVEALICGDNPTPRMAAGGTALFVAWLMQACIVVAQSTDGGADKRKKVSEDARFAACAYIESLKKRGPSRPYCKHAITPNHSCSADELKSALRISKLLETVAKEQATRYMRNSTLINGLSLAAASKFLALCSDDPREPTSFSSRIMDGDNAERIQILSTWIRSFGNLECAKQALRGLRDAAKDEHTAQSVQGRTGKEWQRSPSVHYYGGTYGYTAAGLIKSEISDNESAVEASVGVRFWLRRLPERKEKINLGKIEHAMYHLSRKSNSIVRAWHMANAEDPEA